MAVPTGVHSNNAPEEAETEVRSSQFHYTQEKRGLLPRGKLSQRKSGDYPLLKEKVEGLRSTELYRQAYLYYHQWLFYE